MYKVTKNIFPLEWNLSDDLQVDYHGKKVFGTFVCGGGSTMGYKLAGFDHIGGVEFTDHYSKIYIENHKPKYFYKQDVRDFVKRNDLPDELFDLDLLDGSPPCAAFSVSGSREKGWNKKSKYEDKVQRKDDLVFVYVDLINKLRPKTAILENVKGLIIDNARLYTRKIVKRLNSYGYDVQIFLLNAASMGIPQIRERVFFICKRKDLKLPKIELEFDCKRVNFDITRKYWNDKENYKYSIEKYKLGELWDDYKFGTHKKRFNLKKPRLDRPAYTILESASNLSAASIVHPLQKRKLNKKEVALLCTFPKDYNFLDVNPISVMGRSVLPVMMANISYQIYTQLLK